jgi:hypothetical protein
VLPAAVTRVGVFEYRTDTGVVREYRSAEQVFAAESLATLPGAPVTLDHPTGPVTPANWRGLSRGHVVDGSVSVDASSLHVLADIALDDGEAISRVRAGEIREVSCGYSCDVEDVPGVTPSGEAYDRKQTNIRYNHVALGPRGWGRAGETVALRLDAKGEQIVTQNAPRRAAKGHCMFPKIEWSRRRRTVRVDGVLYPLSTREGRAQAREALRVAFGRVSVPRADSSEQMGALVSALEAALAAAKEMAESYVEDMDDEEKKADEDEEKKADEDEEKKADEDEEKMDSRIAERFAIVERAQALKPGLDYRGKTAAKIMAEALTHVFGAELRADAMRPAELRGAFLVARPRDESGIASLALASAPQSRADGAGVTDPAEAYRERLAGLWKRGV